MSKDNDQKKLWNEESEQLKKDLEKRGKKVVRREVPIKVAKPGQSYAHSSSKKKHGPKKSVSHPMSGDSASDDLLRKQLGL